MKAMVLAAGLGERLKPLTWDRAKPALPLLNRPSILHLLEHLAKSGVNQVAINLHHRPETIRALEPSIRTLGLQVSFSDEPVILGTAGGLKKAEPLLSDGTLVMVNSDLDSHPRAGDLRGDPVWCKERDQSRGLSTIDRGGDPGLGVPSPGFLEGDGNSSTIS